MAGFKNVPVRTTENVLEMSWFDDLCGGDTQFLGQLDPKRASTFEHCSNILLEAEKQKFQNILLPTSYVQGQEVLTFAAALGPKTNKINMLTAIRTGEIHPPMLARHIATLDHILKGRLCINIINSDLPGLKEPADLRYRRCVEVIEILKQAWNQEEIDFQGKIYQMKMSSSVVQTYQKGGPLLYFGGISEGSKDICARYCDVFLMWPEPEESIYATMQEMSQKAKTYGRMIDFGMRLHVIVRDTEKEAKDYAKFLMSKFDEEQALILKNRTQDAQSAGVLRQDAFREKADADDFLERYLWGGIGRARSGCGAAIVGSTEQVLEKIHRYMSMGVRSFVLSGYPLIEESQYVGRLVLPQLPRQVYFNQYQGKL
jgi:alkanesulfonate monooxygenase